MSERFSFTVDRHLVPNLSVDGVVWNQDNIESINSSLSDTMNEGYVTAEDETQYLSVLDSTNEISLENLNITLTNPKLEMEEAAETFITATEEDINQDMEDQQVVVYTVEGSDELYGIQIAQDEEGNLQKYQFQFRKNKEGQLEAIPETIQLLPMDEQVVQEESVEETLVQEEELVEKQGQSLQIFVHNENSSEHILPDNNALAEPVPEEEEEETILYDESEHMEEVDIKPAVLSLHNVKQELQDQHSELASPDVAEEETIESFPENLEHGNVTEYPHTSNDSIADEHLIEYHDHLDHEQLDQPSEDSSNMSELVTHTHSTEYVETAEENAFEHADENTFEHADENTFEHVDENTFEHVEVNPDVNELVQAEPETVEEFAHEDSDVEDYQIVEGMHITGDVEHEDELDQDAVIVEKPTNANIIRQSSIMNKSQKRNKDNRYFLYVVQHPEKENDESLSIDLTSNNQFRVNPRSILKSSHAMLQGRNEQVITESDDRLNKRFARGKEAMQARLFNNFINKTTIPQAPVRKDRLPRKQKIKPVERLDEEIVVQEMMVSSNGFVEAGDVFNKENLEVTEYVELSDSDDDYDPNNKTVNNNKKKKKTKKKQHRRTIEITISDDESNASYSDSVIELDESDEDYTGDGEIAEKGRKHPKVGREDSGSSSSPTKRRRGRPPKNRPSDSSSVSETIESPLKKLRITTTTNETSSGKPEIPCPKCDKTFPSQNSLKTHLQHHNLESSIKNAQPSYHNKYKCDDCGESYKNSILLKRHLCLKRECAICKKRFPNITTLNVHKRVHAKEQLLKNTGVRVSPKKIKPPATLDDKFKPPKPINSLKCKTCGKVCSSLQNLNVHVKTHREYTCGTCSGKFPSQLLLEKHLRESCVKSPRSQRRSRTVSSSSDSVSESEARAPSGVASLRVKCDMCPMMFYTHKALYKHKIVKHGLNTPDKEVVLSARKEGRFANRGKHSGVPVHLGMKKAFEDLKAKLDFGD